MEFHAINNPRVFEEVSRQIQEQIQAGDMPPGDKLPNERDLARALGVSRHSVREAFRYLEATGWIELRKGSTGGAFVATGRPQAVSDVIRRMFQTGEISLLQLTEARLWIESAVIAVACQRVTPTHLRELEENVRLAEEATIAGEWAEKTRLNIKFHLLLAEITENPIFILAMESLMDVLIEFVNKLGSVMGMDVIQSRRRFITHLQAGEHDKAISEMEGHLKILHKHYADAAENLENKKPEKN